MLHPGVGAPLAAMFLENLAAMGVRTVVGVGGAGALIHELTPGHAVVLGSALRDEGTSLHYLPPSRTVDMEAAALVAVARRIGVRYAQLFLAADSLAGPEWEHRGWTTAREARAGLFELAVTAAERWGAGDR